MISFDRHGNMTITGGIASLALFGDIFMMEFAKLDVHKMNVEFFCRDYREVENYPGYYSCKEEEGYISEEGKAIYEEMKKKRYG